MNTFNWDYLEYNLGSHGYSKTSYSVKGLGKYKNYLATYKSTHRIPPAHIIDKMVEDMHLDKHLLCGGNYKEYTTTPAEPTKDEYGIPTESDFEILVKERLETLSKLADEISTKLELIMEMEEKVNQIARKLPDKTPTETANELLNKMLDGKSSCDYDDYLRRLSLIGVDRETGIALVTGGGYTITVTGYGNGKKRWVRKETK